MTTRPSTAERLDHAVERMLAGERPMGDTGLGPMLRVADMVRAALPPIPAGAGFESRLLDRLTEPSPSHATAIRQAAQRLPAWRPGRMLAAGAVSSAALGVTVTALAMWRLRRQAATRMGE